MIAPEHTEEHRYRKLVIAPSGEVVGAILLGYGLDAPGVAAVIREEPTCGRAGPAARGGTGVR